MVVGARPIGTIQHFSAIKRLLQKIGSAVVRSLSGTEIQDAPSGFRALSRNAALRLNVFSAYTYTMETIIQAGRSNLRVINVPIGVNQPTRPSRLISSLPAYVWKSIGTILSAYLIYRPVRIFGLLSAIFLTSGAALAVRYLWLAYVLGSVGHVQSVIASGVLALAGIFMAAFGVAAHLLAINRRLLEELRYLERSRSMPPTTPELKDRQQATVTTNTVTRVQLMAVQVSGLLSPFLLERRLTAARAYIAEGRVLDYGCGNGELARYIDPERYLGLDADPESVAAAKTRHPAHRFLAVDGSAPPNDDP